MYELTCHIVLARGLACYTMLYQCDIIQRNVMCDGNLWTDMSYCASSWLGVLHHAVLSHIMVYCVMSCHAQPYHVWCYAVSWWQDASDCFTTNLVCTHVKHPWISRLFAAFEGVLSCCQGFFMFEALQRISLILQWDVIMMKRPRDMYEVPSLHTTFPNHQQWSNVKIPWRL